MVPLQKDGVQEGSKEPELSVRVSKDRHEAFVSVKDLQPEQKLTESAVTEFLKAQGIVYGLLPDAIRTFCVSHSHEIQCARGILPVDEEKAQLQFLFRTDDIGMPVKLEDGSVDFGNLGTVQNVKKGDVLCRIIPPKPGKDGIDVNGNPVSHRKSRLPSFPSGHNTVVSENGLELTAAIDGCIEYHKNLLNVNETFYVRGNVDNSSGNINFVGTVVVQGDVTQGYTVKAGGDITVHGMVAGATLNAGGSITVSNGVNGMSGGSLTAGGDITARYFQNATLQCGYDVFGDVLMNCSVQAKHSIILRGPNASLMGGKYVAGQQVCAKTIGTPNNVRTDICVDSADLHSAMAGVSARASEIAGLNEKITAEEQAQDNLRKQIDTVKKAIENGNRNVQLAALMKTLMLNTKKSENAVGDLRSRVEELETEPEASTIDFNVIGIRTIYAGTKINIGIYSKYLSSDYSNMKFYVQGDDIVSGPVLPSDEKDY